MTVIDDIDAQVGVLRADVEFLKKFIDSVRSPKWLEVDPDYTQAKAMYTLIKTKIETAVGELPTV